MDLPASISTSLGHVVVWTDLRCRPEDHLGCRYERLVLPIVGAGIIIAGVMEQRPQNQRDVVEAWSDLQSAQSAPLIYPGRRSYSSEFYSSGKSENIQDPAKWPRDSSFYLSRRLRDSNAELPVNLSCVKITEVNASQLMLCRWKDAQQSNNGLAGEIDAGASRTDEG